MQYRPGLMILVTTHAYCRGHRLRMVVAASIIVSAVATILTSVQLVNTGTAAGSLEPQLPLLCLFTTFKPVTHKTQVTGRLLV
jgi:hypothetical protein